MKQLRFFAPLVLLLNALLVAPVSAAHGELQRECIEEPVFRGKACIYQANKSAAQSIVLVHGINGSASDWSRQVPSLAAKYHVIAIDLPGFGASTDCAAHCSPDEYVRLLRFVTQRYAKQPFHLVGHSMGGAIALKYAADYPKDVDRLAVIDVAGILHRITFTKGLVGAWVEGKTGQSGSFVERLTGKVLEKSERLTKRFGSADGGGSSPAERAGRALLDQDFGTILPSVQAPVLIIWGSKDPVAPLRTAKVLKARMPNTRLEILPGIGHVPMSEAAERTTSLLTSHFTKALDGAAMRQLPLLLDPPATERIGRCEEGRGTTEFTGEWKQIDIRHCTGVKIHDARVGRLNLFEARVSITNSIFAGDQPINAVGSEIEMTGGAVRGRIAVEASRSRIDIAGVDIMGSEAAVLAPEPTNLIVSVSKMKSPRRSGPMHDYVVVTPDEPL